MTYAASHHVSSRPRSRLASEPDAGDTPSSSDGVPASNTQRVCLPGTRLPMVHLPAVRLPAVTLPAYTDFDGVRHRARRVPGQRIPGQTIPGQVIPRQCFDVPAAYAPDKTTILADGIGRVDPKFSEQVSDEYWSDTGDASLRPDYSAPGFGETNAAGYPKNQYVRSYLRRDGTFVHGYWRNSPSDGLPTCHVISC